MDARKKDGIERCGRLCESALVNADKAKTQGNAFAADYWMDSAAMWSARAFDWVTL